MSEPQSDDPFKADKRKDETVMLSQDNLADIVSEAKGGAAPAPAQPQPEPASAASSASAASAGESSSNNLWLLVGGIALILLLAVIAFALFGS